MDRRALLLTVLPGLAGCMLVAVAASPRYGLGGGPLIVPDGPGGDIVSTHWYGLFGVTVLATVVGLCLLRFWRYLLLAGGLLWLPLVLGPVILRPPELGPPVLGTFDKGFAMLVVLAMRAAVPLVLIGVLACAQTLVRAGAVGWGAAVAGASVGAQVFGSVLIGAAWLRLQDNLPAWHMGLTLIGLAGAVAAIAARPRGDAEANVDGWNWTRVRFVVAGTLVIGAALVPVVLTRYRLSVLLDVSESALRRHPLTLVAALGLVSLAIALVCAAVSGVWSLAASLTAATVQIGLAAPMLLAVTALFGRDALSLTAAAIGLALGVAAAVSRWRIHLAAGLSVLCAVALMTAVAATTGQPEKLVRQQTTVPVLLLLLLLAATGTALVAGTVPVLARRTAAPAVLGPIVGVMVMGGQKVLEVTYVGADGLPESSYLNPLSHLGTSALLLLIAGAALVGLRVAEVLAARRAERRHTEQVRREAMEAERNRLARPIHDGVLQVLALVQRHGPDLGGRGAELAELAGAQEAALRALITGSSVDAHGDADLRQLVAGLASPAVTVAAPAEPIMLPGPVAVEVRAAIVAALHNVERHAGPHAHAWVLLEQEPDGLRVTVRDDGVGLPPGRLDDAAAAGRIGVVQSIRGRIGDVGGTVTITSEPGAGTEIEIWIPPS
jgi:signal transduction histidine kinase